MAIDRNQSAEKLISLHAAVADGYKARTVRVGDGKFPLCTSPVQLRLRFPRPSSIRENIS